MRKKRLWMVWLPGRALVGGLGLMVILAFMWFISAPPRLPVLAPLADAVSGKRIVIDPGHGGPDGGARSGEGLKEKEIVLDIGLRLKRMFSKVGVYVIMTREEDRDLAPQGFIGRLTQRKRRDLAARARMANSSRADLYLSIHANSFPGSEWAGAQTFYGFEQAESRALARCIQAELVSGLGPNTRKAKGADYRVLKDTKMPAALVEVGFLSNPREARLLGESSYREKIANCIYLGTLAFLMQRYRPESTSPASGNPEADHETRIPRHKPAAVRAAPGEIVLYFAGTGNDDFLSPEIRVVGESGKNRPVADLAKTAIIELFRGPGAESVLRSTWPAGTSLRSVAYSNGRLYVDLDDGFVEAFWGGGLYEELAIYSLVNTVTGIAGIHSVQITIAGRSDASIGGHLALDRPFTRNDQLIGEWKE